MAELAHQFEVNAITIPKWKSEFLKRMSLVFEHGTSNTSSQDSVDLDKLYAQIGQLKVENDFFLKKVPGDWGYQTKNGNDPGKS